MTRNTKVWHLWDRRSLLIIGSMRRLGVGWQTYPGQTLEIVKRLYTRHPSLNGIVLAPRRVFDSSSLKCQVRKVMFSCNVTGLSGSCVNTRTRKKGKKRKKICIPVLIEGTQFHHVFSIRTCNNFLCHSWNETDREYTKRIWNLPIPPLFYFRVSQPLESRLRDFFSFFPSSFKS